MKKGKKKGTRTGANRIVNRMFRFRLLGMRSNISQGVYLRVETLASLL